MSSAAKTSLVNSILAHLGEIEVTSLELDPPPARLTKVLAQLDGDAGSELWMLARHPWLTALSYSTLQATVRAGNWKWQFVFDLPDSYVKLWTCSADAYEAGTEVLDTGAVKKVIRANVASLDVAYTERKGFEAYGADILHAMALYTAGRVAGPLQDNYAKGAALKKEGLDAIASAKTGEANQQFGDCPPMPSGLATLRASSW